MYVQWYFPSKKGIYEDSTNDMFKTGNLSANSYFNSVLLILACVEFIQEPEI